MIGERYRTRSQAHVMTEAELQGTVLRMARERGWQCFVQQQGSKARSSRAHVSRVSGSNGFPDLTLARDGELLFLELKAQDGRLSIEQEAWQLALPRYEVIRPSDLARGRVDELLA